jgi:hypothetical protein
LVVAEQSRADVPGTGERFGQRLRRISEFCATFHRPVLRLKPKAGHQHLAPLGVILRDIRLARAN